MSINKSDKRELLEKLNELLKKQSLFQQEINELQLQITQLKIDEPQQEAASNAEQEMHKKVAFSEPAPDVMREQTAWNTGKQEKETSPKAPFWKKSGMGSEIEQFIGTNLISKIGIAVLIIGVGIGAKYAIDNDLISPLVRIILGYLVGGILTFFALRLKKQYFNFSAVLFSGAMAIYYYITYAAFVYYQLIPQPLTFILMVLFTVLTVFLALHYERQVIAHFGLVGAYLVPFLLKNPDSSVVVLLSYMVIVNCGILFISTKKKWKPLIYLAFLSTWIIYLMWFVGDNYNDQLGISLTYLILFFTIFHMVFLSYKLLLKEKFRIDDVAFLLFNSGILYVVGMVAISGYLDDSRLEGLYTFLNALIHASTALLIYKMDSKNKPMLSWFVGMVIVLLAISSGIQFNEYITTLLWALGAAFLFWLGRNKKIILFEYISFALVGATFVHTIINWSLISYNFHTENISEIFTPVFSLSFLSSIFVIASFAFIFFASRKSNSENDKPSDWNAVFNIVLPLLFLIVLYFTFFNEISLIWNNVQVYATYELNANGIWVKAFDKLNFDIFTFKSVWLFNYSMLFFSVLSFVNFKWLKNKLLNATVFVMSCLLLLIFLSSGLEALSFLRKAYLNTDLPLNYDVTIFHLLIRYVAFMFFALLFYSIYRFVLPFLTNKSFNKFFEIVLSVTVIWVCSSELIHWLSLSGTAEVYRHGLSILWGILSFILIGYGIWKKKKHLRITAIILFAGTICKLFFYDLNNLETIQKTIAFLSIGAILLIVSFMYNKYRTVIFGKD